MSIRALARLLAEGSEDPRRLDQERTNIKRWLNPAKGISDASSERLAPHFDRPPDYYRRAPQPRSRQADRLEELEAMAARQAKTIRDLTKRLKAVEAQLAAAPPQPGTRQRERGGQ